MATTTLATINFFGSGGIFAAGALFGSLVVAMVQHFCESRRLKKERQFQLQKEIYFNLQKKAGKVLWGMHLLDRRVNEYKIALERILQKKQNLLPVFSDDFLKERISVPVNLEIFFPDTAWEEYNECVDIIQQMTEHFFDPSKNISVVREDVNKFNELLKKFRQNMIALREKIFEELKKEKAKIP